MGQIKWYKRDPSAALNGMMELDLQERGAYNTVLDLIYSRDGNLPDDDRFIAGWLRVDVRVWKRIKSTLIERGKLFVSDGKLRNERADVEVLAALSRVASAQDAGRASARSKAGKFDGVTKENNHLVATGVATDAPTTVSTNHNHNQIEEEPIGSPSKEDDPPRKRRAHATNERAQGLNPRATGTNPRAKPSLGVNLPDWVPLAQWDAFIDMRRRKGAFPTDHAAKLLLGKLEKLRASGQDPGAVLDQSTLKNWTDIYPLKDADHGNRYQAEGSPSAGHSGPDRRDGFTRAIHDELERTGAFEPPGAAGRYDADDAAGDGGSHAAEPPALR